MLKDERIISQSAYCAQGGEDKKIHMGHFLKDIAQTPDFIGPNATNRVHAISGVNKNFAAAMP